MWRSWRTWLGLSRFTKPFSSPKPNLPLLPTPSPALLPKSTFPKPTQPSPTTEPSDKPRKPIFQPEMQERRAKGSCMFCEEPDTPGHHLEHKRSQLFVMDVGDVDDGEEEIYFEPAAEGSQDEHTADDAVHISVHALTGVSAFQTMRVTGSVGKEPLHILINSGSSHNFLDQETAKLLNCKAEELKPLAVSVADGNKLCAMQICRGVSCTNPIDTTVSCTKC